MGSEYIPQLLLAIFFVASPRALVADDCPTSPASSISISASSYRNRTGHWITNAALTRKSPRDVKDVRIEERPLNYNMTIARRSCGDDEITTTTFSISAPPARVGADYTFFPNVGYYKLHADKMNWEDARRTCEREGAHLAIVNSEAEEKAILEVMSHHDIEYFAFIGFHDKFKEGEYVTVLGDPLNSTGRVRWSEWEPNNANFSPEGEDCGAIYKDGTLNDVSCYGTLHFVCEQPL